MRARQDGSLRLQPLKLGVSKTNSAVNRRDNIVAAINSAEAKPTSVDAETSQVLNFAERLYELSEGGFDVTSGVLRQVWRFDGGTEIPGDAAVAQLLERVGWDKVSWDGQQIQLRAGMEIDLGGIGKEYAVDCAARLLSAADSSSCPDQFRRRSGSKPSSYQGQGLEYWGCQHQRTSRSRRKEDSAAGRSSGNQWGHRAICPPGRAALGPYSGCPDRMAGRRSATFRHGSRGDVHTSWHIEYTRYAPGGIS